MDSIKLTIIMKITGLFRPIDPMQIRHARGNVYPHLQSIDAIQQFPQRILHAVPSVQFSTRNSRSLDVIVHIPLGHEIHHDGQGTVSVYVGYEFGGGGPFHDERVLALLFYLTRVDFFTEPHGFVDEFVYGIIVGVR